MAAAVSNWHWFLNVADMHCCCVACVSGGVSACVVQCAVTFYETARCVHVITQVVTVMITCRFADSPIRRHPDSSTSRFVDNPIRRQPRVSPSTNRDKKIVENAGLEKSQFVDNLWTRTWSTQSQAWLLPLLGHIFYDTYLHMSRSVSIDVIFTSAISLSTRYVYNWTTPSPFPFHGHPTT